MKDFIYNNYNINVDKIYSKDDELFFFINNDKIIIKRYKEINEKGLIGLISLTNELLKKGLPINSFLFTKDNNYYKKYNNYYIILLKKNDIESNISLNQLKIFNNIYPKIDDYNPIYEWKEEVDSIEKRIIEYNKEYPLIQKSINYYIGCAENAIELLSFYKMDITKHNDSVAHKITYKMYNECKLNDPFTFIKANKSYDLANYIKYKFITNTMNYEELDSIFNSLSEYEKSYLFSCLLYPNIYFDLIKNVFNQKIDEQRINNIIKNNNNYRKLLVYCQEYFKNNSNIRMVRWINTN